MTTQEKIDTLIELAQEVVKSGDNSRAWLFVRALGSLSESVANAAHAHASSSSHPKSSEMYRQTSADAFNEALELLEKIK